MLEHRPVDNRHPREIIGQRRRQVMVHACIYYRLNDNLVSDQQWDHWNRELARLQREHPDCCNLGYFDYYFEDWRGTTGVEHILPLSDPKIVATAMRLLKYDRENKRLVIN